MNAVIDNRQTETLETEVFIPAAQSQSLVHINKMLPAMTLDEASERYTMFVSFVKQQLKQDVDFGIIPGTGDKKVLLKPGAEKLCTFFGLRPILTIVEKEEDWQGYAHEGEPFFYYKYKCDLYRGDVLIASSEASCNSWEKKYRYRQGQLKCPECGKATVFKSKQGEGWYCWTKKDGCGANFAGHDGRIKNQDVGRVSNPEIFDQVNTLQKMAQKRALVGSTIIAANASEFFTQDLEDLKDWQPDGSAQPQNNIVDFPRDPVAKTVKELVTDKQLGMIRAMSRDLGINPEEECQAVLGCKTDELSRKAASSLIEHFKKMGEEQALEELRGYEQQRPTAEKNVTPTKYETVDKTNPETRSKRGAAIAAMGNVSRKDNGYQVLTPALRGRQVSYEVWRNGQQKIRCSCLEFEENVAIDENYKCEHIYAVSFFVAAEKKQQATTPTQQPTANVNPATEKMKLIVELAGKANVDIEDECQRFFNLHPDDLNEQQEQEFIEQLQTIILEQETSSSKTNVSKNNDEWNCSPETRKRIEKLANDIAAHPLGKTKAELLKMFREQFKRKDVPQGLNEIEAASAALGLEKYLNSLDEDLKTQQELDAKGNNRK